MQSERAGGEGTTWQPRRSARRWQELPAGTRPVLVPDRYQPGVSHLVGATDGESVWFWRRQDGTHHQVLLATLMSAELAELVDAIRQEALRQGLLPSDVVRQLLARMRCRA